MRQKNNFNQVSILNFTLMGCFFAANQRLVENIAYVLGANKIQMGYMISALYGGSIIAVLFFGELAQRAGKRMAALSTSLTVFLGSVIVLSLNSIPGVIVGFFIYGIGVAGYESNMMSLVADNNGDNANRFLNLVQAVFSAGAVVTPILLVLILRHVQYRLIYAVIACCYAGFALYWYLNKGIDRFAVRSETTRGFTFFRLLRDYRIVLYMLAMFIFIGSETALTYWIGSYFELEGIGGYAAIALSLYWFSSIFGRLAGSRVRSPARMMAPYFGIAAVSFIFLLLAPGAPLKITAVILIGVAFAPIYASFAFLAGRLYPEESASAIALIVFSSGLGGVAFQPFISLFISSGNSRTVYMLIAILCAAMAAIMFLLNRRSGIPAGMGKEFGIRKDVGHK